MSQYNNTIFYFIGNSSISNHDKAVSLEGIPITQVTKVRTICTVFEEQSSLKVMLSEIHKLLLIYLTVPITTATAERSFKTNENIPTKLNDTTTTQSLYDFACTP